MTSMKKMTEGRRTQVVLLDDRRLEIVVQTRLTVAELMNIVASHCHLKDPDKQYFGLAFQDDKQQLYWLHDDRRVLDHEFPKKLAPSSAVLTLHHLVKFYVDSFMRFANAASVELLFLQVRNQIYRNVINVDHDTIFQLGALLVQAYYGDFRNENATRNAIKKLPVFPESVLRYYYSPLECEDQVIEIHKNLTGMSRGSAVVKYLTLVERIETYGMHFYEVKDKVGSPFVLGFSSRGIFQFNSNDKSSALRSFGWNQLENLYYRDKKFSVEVHDPRRVVHVLSSFNPLEDAFQSSTVPGDNLIAAIGDPTTQVSLSRRTFVPSNVHVLVYLCESPQLCKNIWSLAISQHQFYLDNKAISKKDKNVQIRHINELLDNLNKLPFSAIRMHTDTSNNSTSDLGSSVSSQSLRSLPNMCYADEEQARDSEFYKQLQSRKQALELLLIEKLKELKDVCIQEGNITGEIPSELYSALAPGEAEPKIKRRVGTSFSISPDLVNKLVTIDHISKLEADVEIKRKIVAGHEKLVNDPSVSSVVRRRRRQDLKQAMQQLKQLENQLEQLCLTATKYSMHCINYSHSPYKSDKTNSVIRGQASPFPCNSLGRLQSCRNAASSMASNSRLSPLRGRDALPYYSQAPSTSASNSRLRSASIPNSPNLGLRCGQDSVPCSSGLLELNMRQSSSSAVGYRPFVSYQSKYRQQNYPTLLDRPNVGVGCSRSMSSQSLQNDEQDVLSPLRLFPKVDAVDHALGSYNVPQQRTSWDQDCLERMNHAVLGSSESVNSGLTHRSISSSAGAKVAVPGCNGQFPGMVNYVGSLDRRQLKNRGAGATGLLKRLSEKYTVIGRQQQQQQQQQQQYQESYASMDHSPPRYPSRGSATMVACQSALETVRPYSNDDYLKYTNRQPAIAPARRVQHEVNLPPTFSSPQHSAMVHQRTGPKAMIAHDVQDVLSWYDESKPLGVARTNASSSDVCISASAATVTNAKTAANKSNGASSTGSPLKAATVV
ncbi:FERM domain-containing protein 4A [Trichinella papuae]|uniref:FERM domain-containing protein 4A n=1 Tax=Trichinella papuae TaxID=268474 RepID=A0A0V1MFS7_9BILA|nr:FERM domain-containing protein 4A [Trichinella papuae]